MVKADNLEPILNLQITWGGGGGHSVSVRGYAMVKADNLELILNLQITLKGGGGGGGDTLRLWKRMCQR